MHEDRPHLCVLGDVEPLPALTAVRAAVRATARAEIDHVRVRRVHGDRLDVGHLRQPLGQPFPAIVTGGLPEDTADRLGADCCRTDVDVGAHGHVLSWVTFSGPRLTVAGGRVRPPARYDPAAGTWCRRSQIRTGVAGMSMWSTPRAWSASRIALITAGGAPTDPASPTPLTPSGFVLHGTSWKSRRNGGRWSGRGMQYSAKVDDRSCPDSRS